MVTIRKEERANPPRELLTTTTKVIAKKPLSVLTFCVALLLFMNAGKQPDLPHITHEALHKPIISNKAVAKLKNQQPSSSQLSATHDDILIVEYGKESSFQPPSPKPSPPQLPPQASLSPEQILRKEFAMRQALPAQPYTPSLAEISAFNATIRDICNAHNRPGFRFAPLVDKHAIKEWVHSVTPNLYVAKEYAHVDASNVTALTAEILQQFPSQKFMVKAAHTSGCVAIASMETNTVTCLKPPCFKNDTQPEIDGTVSMVSSLQDVCQTYLDTDFTVVSGEEQYANIPRRCILEEQLDFSASSTLFDYKIHTFHGRPTLIAIHGNRSRGEVTKYARTPYDWKEVPLAFRDQRSIPLSDEQLGPRPDFLDDMLRDTQILVQRAIELVGESPYIRVDFFVYQQAVAASSSNDDAAASSSFKVAFAELTFTHANCGHIFRRHHPWANKLYGFIGQHPDYIISPNSILDLLEEEKNNKMIP